MSQAPVFSFVATSRNDDHGGDVLRRTQSFLTRLAEQCNRHQVAAELVLVDWNPPRSRAPLADVLAWPAGSEWFSARVVTVPPALHDEFAFSRRLAMFQMIAKNVGIRRALGEHIIATNIDIIFSDDLFRWLRSGSMRSGILYRSDRWDIPNEIQLESDLDVLLERAHHEHIRRNLCDGTYIIRDNSFINTYGVRVDHSIIFPIQGLLRRLQSYIRDDASFDRDNAIRQIEAIITQDVPQLRRNFLLPDLHTNGCGDFTMMSRQDWFRLRGYPEWHVFSWNIDSIIVFQAYYNAISVEMLAPSCVHYHIEHDYGSGWTPEGANSLWSRLDQLGLPYIDYRSFYELIYALQDNAAENRESLYNDPDWGLGASTLEMQIMAGPDTPPRPPKAANANLVDENFLNALIPVAPGIGLDHGTKAADDVQIQWRTMESGKAEIAVESRPEMWTYAFYFDLQSLQLPPGEYWVKLQIVVDDGEITVGVLNLDESNFLSQIPCAGIPGRAQTVFANVRDITEASMIVVRNVTVDNRPARFRLQDVALLREDTVQDEALLRQRPDIAAKRKAGLTLALRSDDGAVGEAKPKPEPERVALGPPVAASIQQIRPLGSDAIVRVLGRSDAINPQDAEQAMIILPANGDAAAVLDLDPSLQREGKIVVHLHVMEGEAMIGLQTRTAGQILAERRESAGGPLTRLELDTGADANLAGLVFRNACAAGPATLILHRVEYHGLAT